MKIKRIGVDLAKNVFQLHGVDCKEQVILQRRLKRASWLKVLFSKAEPGCEIGMEACTGAHHWGRLLQSKGQGKADCPAVRETVCEEQQK
jgi:transposase